MNCLLKTLVGAIFVLTGGMAQAVDCDLSGLDMNMNGMKFFTNAEVIFPDQEKQEKAHIAVEKNTGRIAGVYKNCQLPNNQMEEVDMTGKVLMPGLQDCQTYMWGDQMHPVTFFKGAEYTKIQNLGQRMLSVGVTGYCSLNGVVGHQAPYYAGILANRNWQKNGQILSPRIVSTGSIFTRRGAHSGGTANLVEDMKSISVKTQWYAGVYKPDMVVLNHRPNRGGAAQMTKEQVRGILLGAHGFNDNKEIDNTPGSAVPVFIFTNSWQGIYDVLTWVEELRAEKKEYQKIAVTGFSHIPLAGKDKAAKYDKENVVKLMLKHGVSVTSSFNAYLNRYRVNQGLPSSELSGIPLLDDPLVKKLVPQELIDAHQGGKAYDGKVEASKALNESKEMQESLAFLIEKGVPVMTGTGSALPSVFFGPATIIEMEMWKESGVSNWDVLKGATTNFANQFQKAVRADIAAQYRYGKIAEGYYADFLVFPADKSPKDNISNLRAKEAVYMSGQKIDESKLDFDLDMDNK